MQEEVTQKTIALYVKVGKGAARLTEQALQKAIQKFLEQKSKPAHGKQTMRQLMKQNAGVSNIEITDSNIIAEWEKEYATLSGQRTAEYTKLKETRAEVAELHNIRKCVDIALKADQPEQTRAKRHEQER